MKDENFLYSGQIKVSRNGGELKTVLGSCICICIYDQRLKFGGMNHFLLPSRDFAPSSSLGDWEFGDTSTVELIRRFKKQGSRPEDLIATISGGAQVDRSNPIVGKLNLEMAENLLTQFGIPVRGRSVGGSVSRKVVFKTATGEIMVQSQPHQEEPEVQIDKPIHGLICIGASTGGTEVIRQILSQLSPPCPPILIVQHMPHGFTGMFAESLNTNSALKVQEVRSGEQLRMNNVYLAKGGLHMGVTEKAGKIYVKTNDDAPMNLFKPSVDYLFYSVSGLKTAGKGLAILLTGMGEDGAYGLRSLRQRGCKTFVQSESSCIVYGMPKVAMDIGAAEKALPPQDLIKQIQYFNTEYNRKASA